MSKTTKRLIVGAVISFVVAFAATWIFQVM